MKKNLFAIIIILALLVSMLPMQSVFAASQGTSTINIRNKTGGTINLLLINTATGKKSYVSLKADTYWVSLPSGSYTYAASTPCSQKSGFLNLTRKAELLFTCTAGQTLHFKAH